MVISNQLIFGPFCRRQNLLPSLFTLAFRNKMQYRYVYACINSCTNASTLSKKLVNTGPVTLECKKGICRIFAATGPQFDDRRSFGMLASETYWNITIFILADQSAIMSVHLVEIW